MLQVNKERSKVQEGIGAQKCLIVIDSPSREDLEDGAASKLAMEAAIEHGFQDCGLSDAPVINAINADTGECLTDDEALTPGIPLGGFRGEFTLSRRL